MRQKIIIDCDPGIDDALLIAIALQDSEIDILGITTVAGNKDVERTTINALRTLEYFGRQDVPVYGGAPKPLKKDLYIPSDDTSHGKDGLGDCGLPIPKISAKDGAVEFLKEQIEKNPKEVTLFCTGPLTNIARLLEKTEPSLIKKIYTMNGAFWTKGNQTEFAEYNNFIDPEAAGMVYGKNIPTRVVGLDVTNQIGLNREQYEEISSSFKSPVAQFLAKIYKYAFYRKEKELYVIFWDILTIFWFLYPEIFASKRGLVKVETEGEKAGMTKFSEGQGSIEVASGVDSTRFLEILMNLLRS